MPPVRADPRLQLALAWLAGFTLIDASIVSLALPDIARDFDRGVGELAWVSSGYLLALAATLLAAGRLNDRYGSRLVLGFGGVAFLLLTAACGLAPTFELLVVARMAQGIAGGILYTVSLAIVVTAFPPERRASAIGVYFTSGAGMLTWNAATPIWLVVANQLLNGAGISIALVASADDAMAQFTPAEAGTGSALFNVGSPGTELEFAL